MGGSRAWGTCWGCPTGGCLILLFAGHDPRQTPSLVECVESRVRFALILSEMVGHVQLWRVSTRQRVTYVPG